MDDSQRSDGFIASDAEREKRRIEALQQAEQVIEAVGGESHLDGFNLLGVIANPRGTTASITPSSFHGRYSTAVTSPTTASAASTTTTTTSATDVFSDPYHTFEHTLTQVTEQMEALNQMLEDWSRHILEEDPYSVSEELPESQLKELPAELTNLNLQPLQAYLERSGVVANAFQQILLNDQQQSPLENIDGGSFVAATDAEDLSNELNGIPSMLFLDDFDLTDPETFRELMIVPKSDQNVPLSETIDDNVSVQEWFQLVPPDWFSTFLDKVEICLLNQVRSKSGAFFEESLRFALLQEWIQTSLKEVTELQSGMKSIRKDLLDPIRMIPEADSKKEDLQRLTDVLEQTDELLYCKSSIGGVLSAQDDLAAIEQIKYGRRLLAGNAESDDPAERIELHRLHALKSVAEQLNQYEELVVTNLREELVEIFMGWNSAAVSSVYSMSSPSTTSAEKSHRVQERVREIVKALRVCKGLPKTKTAFNNRLQDVVRMIVRTTVAEFATENGSESASNVTKGVTAMSLKTFLDCLDMLFEQLLSQVKSAAGVDVYCGTEGIWFDDENDSPHGTSSGKDSADFSEGKVTTPLGSVVSAAADSCTKSIAELLRLRKEAHTLISLDEMRAIWSNCLSFINEMEKVSGNASNLRSTLMAQAKAFVERKHESNMSALVAALDSERWTQCQVSSERQAALIRLCSGRTLVTSPPRRANGTSDEEEKLPEAEVEGVRYKVVWSCLLLIEMLLADIQCAVYFPGLASNVVGKVVELLRIFNTRSTNLVLGAGAIHSSARLKSINAKHLSLVTQCLGIIISILPHVRAALLAQMPKKQHTLLADLDQIKKEFGEHNEKVLNKLVLILGGIVEHGLAPKIPGTDFDARAKSAPPDEDGQVKCCVFIDGVSTNCRKMHQVLSSLLPPEHLRDVFSRIFAFIDRKIPSLFIAASEAQQSASPAAARTGGQVKPAPPAPLFVFPQTEVGKKRMLVEIDILTKSLNALEGVHPWDFTAVAVLERRLEVKLNPSESSGVIEQEAVQTQSSSSPSSTDDPPADEKNGAGIVTQAEDEKVGSEIATQIEEEREDTDDHEMPPQSEQTLGDSEDHEMPLQSKEQVEDTEGPETTIVEDSKADSTVDHEADDTPVTSSLEPIEEKSNVTTSEDPVEVESASPLQVDLPSDERNDKEESPESDQNCAEANDNPNRGKETCENGTNEKASENGASEHKPETIVSEE